MNTNKSSASPDKSALHKPRQRSSFASLPTATGHDDGTPLVLHSAGWQRLPDGRQQLSIDCATILDFATLPRSLQIGPLEVFKADWDVKNRVALFQEGRFEAENLAPQINEAPHAEFTEKIDPTTPPGEVSQNFEGVGSINNLCVCDSPRLFGVPYGTRSEKVEIPPINNDEVEKRIAEAPGPFRERLERLHREGLLTDPKFKEAVLKAAQRVRERTEEEWLAIEAGRENDRRASADLQSNDVATIIGKTPVQNPPPKKRPKKRGFPGDSQQRK